MTPPAMVTKSVRYAASANAKRLVMSPNVRVLPHRAERGAARCRCRSTARGQVALVCFAASDAVAMANGADLSFVVLNSATETTTFHGLLPPPPRLTSL